MMLPRDIMSLDIKLKTGLHDVTPWLHDVTELKEWQQQN